MDQEPSCLNALLERRAGTVPDAPAILAPGREPLSYGRLFVHVRRTVEILNEMGIGRHDRVATVLPNGCDMAVAFLAVAAGATSAPLNPGYERAISISV